jgi:hypothetical protein
MSDMVELYKQNPPFPSVDEFNKRTIVRAKEQILLLLRDITMPPPPPRPTPPMQSSSVPERSLPQRSPMPNPPPVPPSPIMEEQDTSEDADHFLKKLQNLELQRNATMVPSANPRPQEESVVLTPKPSQPPPPSGTTVLYLPTPTDAAMRTSKPFVIHSGDRMWSYFHDRSILSWEGPLPASDTFMNCTSLLISPSAHITSPIVRVEIEGPGGHTSETICTFMRKGRKWDMWQPASSTIATMRTIPTPWTIRLFDVTGRLLDLGKDGYTIREATALINKNTKWVFHEPIAMLTRGMVLLCRHMDGTVRRHTALHVHENSVEVEGRHTEVVGCLCAVDDLQVTLVFEVIKNETPPASVSAAHGNSSVPAGTIGGGTVRGAIETPSKSGK